MNTVRCRFCDFVRRDDDNRPKPNRASQCFHHLYTGCSGQSEKPEIVRLTSLATRWAQVWCASFPSRFLLSNLPQLYQSTLPEQISVACNVFSALGNAPVTLGNELPARGSALQGGQALHFIKPGRRFSVQNTLKTSGS